jgi:membrane associated rhomboid family serine protease
METIRAARTSGQVDEWALVLTAAGIPHRVEADGAGWALLVPADEAPRAYAALAAYDEESRRERDAPTAERASSELPWTLGAIVGLLLLGFFAVTGPPVAGSRWFERGAASAGQMRSEPWRAVTALTLHADAVHVAGNAVATAVLVPAVAQRLGAGCGVLLVLLVGAAANLLGAVAHDPRHVAVGASTATFGAIGILVALRLFPTPVAPRPRRKGWTVAVAGLVFLAMLGAGQNADVPGHALGLVTGGALGVVAGVALPRPPRPAAQWALGALATLLVVGCWRLALVGL